MSLRTNFCTESLEWKKFTSSKFNDSHLSVVMVNLLSLNQLLAVLSSLQTSSLAMQTRLSGTHSGKSLTYSKKRNGPRIDPCGTPVLTVDNEEFLP